MLQIWAPASKHHGKPEMVDGSVRAMSSLRWSGDSESILRMERSILNLLEQLSGIATNAAQWATIAPRQVAATHQTVWGMLDKWAVHLGGGLTHRLNKDDATMIEENDLAVSGEGGMQAIVQLLSTMDVANCGAFLELEVTNEKDAIVAASTWKQRQESESLPQLVLMLDNFGPERSRRWLVSSPRWVCVMQSFSKQVETSSLMIWKNGVNAVSMFSQPVPSIELLLSISACSSTNEVDPWIMLPTRPSALSFVVDASSSRSCSKEGMLADSAVIAHGRGEHDYLLSETTIPSADVAAQIALQALMQAKHPVLSVNGNVVALAGDEMLKLADRIGCPLESTSSTERLNEWMPYSQI